MTNDARFSVAAHVTARGAPAPDAETTPMSSGERLKSKPRPPANFTMLWPADYCRTMQELNRTRPDALRFLWGGHNLQTRFSHFGVRPGDTLYPVSVAKKRLLLIGRMTVQSVGDLREYLREHPRDRAMVYHGCATEVLIGTHGSLLHFDLPVPGDVLERWRFASNRGERPIKDLTNGEISNPMTFQGTYRVTDATARDLFNLLLDHEANQQLRAAM